MHLSFSGRQSPRANPFNGRHSSSVTDDTYDTTSQSEITSIGSDGSDEVSFAELGLTEDYFSNPEGHFGLSTVEELEAAIENCKFMIQNAKEHSERKKKLVQKLIELRMKFQELKEGPDEFEPKMKHVLEHKLRKRRSKSINHYCDCCNGLIWGVLQVWYSCRECGLNCHSKCVNSIRRKCITSNSDNFMYILSISPEKGLSWQQFNCIECKNPISIEGDGREEARLCDYTGHYFCPRCHWNDECILPARVLRGWDFSQQKIARQSFRILKRLYRTPLLNLQELNPLLFNYVDELRDIRKLREDILLMKEYFVTCNNAIEQKQLLKLSHRQHFVDNSAVYSMEDLVLLKQGDLLDEIAKIHAEFAQHIKLDCLQCQVKGFYCEICNTGETLFAFNHGVAVCPVCKAVFHKDCFMFGDCSRCERMRIKRERKKTLDLDEEELNRIENFTVSMASPEKADDASSSVGANVSGDGDSQENMDSKNAIASLKKVSMQPYGIDSNMLRSRMSLPILGQQTMYSVSSPEKPDYKHDWDAAIEKDFSEQPNNSSTSTSNADNIRKERTKHRLMKTDDYNDRCESNPITKRPQRNESDYGDLIKVRGRSRNKSGRKSTKELRQIDINDPFGNLHETKGSKFIKEIESMNPNSENPSVGNPFESHDVAKRVTVNNVSRQNPFDTERPTGEKFIDQLTDDASSKTGLSKYNTSDPSSVPFSQNESKSPDSSISYDCNPRFLVDAFDSHIKSFRQSSWNTDMSSKSQNLRHPSYYHPSLDPFQSGKPSGNNDSKNPFE